MKKLFPLVLTLLLIGSAKANDLPPLASFVDDVNRGFFFAGETVTFDGSSSIDRDNGGLSISRYLWKVDGVTVQDGSSHLLTTSFSLTSGQNSKTVQVTLEVQDNEGTWNEPIDKMIMNYTVRSGQDRHFYIKDHLGSVRVTVDEAGDPIGFDDYYPYGLQMPTRSSNLSNPNDAYKYTGHERDTEVGLTFDYMGARSYDPMLGTFMQIDPLMEFATPYSYVGGNPVNLTDPTGMSSCKDAKGDPVLFSAAEADPCDPSSEAGQEIKKEEEQEEQSSGYNTYYGIRIDERLLVPYKGDGSGNDHIDNHRRGLQLFLNKYGRALRILFGEGGKYEEVKITMELAKYTYGGERLSEQAGNFTYGKQGTPVEDFFNGKGDPVSLDFGLDELEMVLYINPENSEGSAEFGNTPSHEMTHVFYTLIHAAEGLAIPTGGQQHDLFLGKEVKYNRIFINALLNN